MTEEIIRKLAVELTIGITTEVQVVYLLAGIRKLIERDNVEEQYSHLKFHCDWTLHARMSRRTAKAILRQFDIAQPLLKTGVRIYDLPAPLGREIDRIIKMKSFEEELSSFLKAYKLPPFTEDPLDGWAKFLHLYTKVVEDIPLMFTSHSPEQTVVKVTLHYEGARETVKHDGWEDMPFKVTWRIFDKNEEYGELFVLNSFCLNSPGSV